MPKKGIKAECPHCGEYGRVVTREPVVGKAGSTYFAASCRACGRSDRTRAKFVSRYVVKCKGVNDGDQCGEPLMLAELLSYDGRCLACAHAYDEMMSRTHDEALALN